MRASKADFLFVCKKDGHKTLCEFIEGAPLNQHTAGERKPGKRTFTYRQGWIEAVPLGATARMRSDELAGLCLPHLHAKRLGY